MSAQSPKWASHASISTKTPNQSTALSTHHGSSTELGLWTCVAKQGSSTVFHNSTQLNSTSTQLNLTPFVLYPPNTFHFWGSYSAVHMYIPNISPPPLASAPPISCPATTEYTSTCVCGFESGIWVRSGSYIPSPSVRPPFFPLPSVFSVGDSLGQATGDSPFVIQESICLRCSDPQSTSFPALTERPHHFPVLARLLLF